MFRMRKMWEGNCQKYISLCELSENELLKQVVEMIHLVDGPALRTDESRMDAIVDVDFHHVKALLRTKTILLSLLQLLLFLAAYWMIKS